MSVRVGDAALKIMAETRQTEAPPAISIVIAARNEAGNITPLLSEIADALGKSLAFEVICVNDGSTDNTEVELTLLMASRPWLRHVKHQVACGKSAALRTGVRYARAPIIVTLDGDCQNDPAFILPLLKAFAAGAPRVGLVAGQRVGHKAAGLQSRFANAVRSALLHDGTRDSACGFTAFRRDLFLVLPYFDGLERFLPALVRREGFDVAYVDVGDRPRLYGAPNDGLRERARIGMLDLFGVWWLLRRRRQVPDVQEVKRRAD
jgi:dolichol-phosphate mannosyltransferase